MAYTASIGCGTRCSYRVGMRWAAAGLVFGVIAIASIAVAGGPVRDAPAGVVQASR